jgi:hypothetical protein
VLLVVAVSAVAVSGPVTSPDNVPVRDKAGVVVGLVTVPVKPPPLTKEKFVTEPPASVLDIIIFEPEVVIAIPVPGISDNAPSRPLILMTPSVPLPILEPRSVVPD